MDEKVFGADRWARHVQNAQAFGAWAKNTDPALDEFCCGPGEFRRRVLERVARSALLHGFSRGAASASHKAAGEIEGAVEGGRPLSPAQHKVWRMPSGPRSLSSSGLWHHRSRFWRRSPYRTRLRLLSRRACRDRFVAGQRELNTIGAWVLEPSGAEAMRTMAFQQDGKKPALSTHIVVNACHSCVAFHPDGSLTSYSECCRA